MLTSSVLLRAPSFRSRFETWNLTVLSLMPSATAKSWFRPPRDTRSRTSRSRALSGRAVASALDELSELKRRLLTEWLDRVISEPLAR
jgi:hypothetical protein